MFVLACLNIVVVFVSWRAVGKFRAKKVEQYSNHPEHDACRFLEMTQWYRNWIMMGYLATAFLCGDLIYSSIVLHNSARTILLGALYLVVVLGALCWWGFLDGSWKNEKVNGWLKECKDRDLVRGWIIEKHGGYRYYNGPLDKNLLKIAREFRFLLGLQVLHITACSHGLQLQFVLDVVPLGSSPESFWATAEQIEIAAKQRLTAVMDRAFANKTLSWKESHCARINDYLFDTISEVIETLHIGTNVQITLRKGCVLSPIPWRITIDR